uniref:Rap1 GTPase-GDP dissociation stimulator 1 n=1 Tax=Hucho hucho TaxID=62062 RepID=A0A4W5K9S8_9TELE
MADNLSDALKKLKLASADSSTDSVESCLDCLLKALAHNNADASEKIQEMGVLPLLPTLLAPQSSCTPKVANIIAEVAKNGEALFAWFLHTSSHPPQEASFFSLLVPPSCQYPIFTLCLFSGDLAYICMYFSFR